MRIASVEEQADMPIHSVAVNRAFAMGPALDRSRDLLIFYLYDNGTFEVVEFGAANALILIKVVNGSRLHLGMVLAAREEHLERITGIAICHKVSGSLIEHLLDFAPRDYATRLFEIIGAMLGARWDGYSAQRHSERIRSEKPFDLIRFQYAVGLDPLTLVAVIRLEILYSPDRKSVV